MNRIRDTFEKLRKRGEKALVAYVTAGDPNLDVTGQILLRIARAGVDLMEIGIPFSDPTADGPVIQGACQRALASGTTLEGVFALLRKLRGQLDVPLVLFTYYNPILAYGLERFVEEASRCGLDGILVVDLPLEEWEELRCYTDRAGLDFITLVAPTTGPHRLSLILRRATGFVYCISSMAVTGTIGPSLEEISGQIDHIRKLTDLPIAIGFGISQPEQARAVGGLADGVVVGSAIVRAIENYGGQGDVSEKVASLVWRFKQAIRGSDGPLG